MHVHVQLYHERDSKQICFASLWFLSCHWTNTTRDWGLNKCSVREKKKWLVSDRQHMKHIWGPTTTHSDSSQCSLNAFSSPSEQVVKRQHFGKKKRKPHFLPCGFPERFDVQSFPTKSWVRTGRDHIILCEAVLRTPWRLTNHCQCQCLDCFQGNESSEAYDCATSFHQDALPKPSMRVCSSVCACMCVWRGPSAGRSSACIINNEWTCRKESQRMVGPAQSLSI